MAKHKLEVEIVKEGRSKYALCKLYTKNKVRRISGHRFVALLGKEPFMRSYLDLLLSFLGLAPFVENEYTKIGTELEEAVILTQTNQYEMYEFTTKETAPDGRGNYGDMFKDKEFTGLIDAWDWGAGRLLEIKNYFSKFKIKFVWKDKKRVQIIPDSYYLQSRLYLYLWNKHFPDKRVPNIDVVAHYVDPDLHEKAIEFIDDFAFDEDKAFVEAKRAELGNLNKRNISVFTVKEDNNFQDLIDLALRRKNLLCKPHEDENGIYYRVKINWRKQEKELIEEIKENPDIEVMVNE